MYNCVFLLLHFLLYGVFHCIQSKNVLEIANAVETNKNITPIRIYDWLHNIVPSNYDETVSPARFMNDKTRGVTVSILPISISDISEKNMYFEVELQFRIYWKEPRLPYDEIRNRTSLIFVSPPIEFLNLVWKPYVRFTNCKLCENERRIAHAGIKHLDIWLKVLEGTISLTYRQAFKFSCYFDLRKYPLDSHICNIYIEAVVLLNERGYIFLNIEPLNNYSGSHYVRKYIPAQYKLNDVVFANECSDLNPFVTNKASNECIRISFQFHRLIYNDLMLLYLPSFFIVVVSWLSFWMDVEASAPRVALGLTSLLTLSTQFASAQSNLPPVSYIKAMDVWMLTCSFMVFISLVEYFLSYQLRKWKQSASIRNETLTPVHPIFKTNHLQFRHMKKIEKETVTATTKVDFIARIIFPASFLVFNIAYWGYYI